MGRGQRREGATVLPRRSVIERARTLIEDNPAARQVQTALTAAGGQVCLVGGAVRDLLLDQTNKDIDLVVANLDQQQVAAALSQLPGQVNYTGKDFAVFRYRQGDQEIEIALARKEYSTGVGHKDFAVSAGKEITIREDLARRDFTVNAMAIDLNGSHLIDPFGGQDDISAARLRIIHDQALAEDPLRIVRALVIHARYGFIPDQDTRASMISHASGIDHLPPERMQIELDKMFAASNPAQAIRLAEETGVLTRVLPRLAKNYHYQQNNHHHNLSLGQHSVAVLEEISSLSSDRDLRLAALLHDIGKPQSAWTDPTNGETHYYRQVLANGQTVGQDHAAVGAQLARETMSHLRYPNERIDRVGQLIEHHMWSPFETEKGARRFLARVEPHADDLLLLREADNRSKSVPHRDSLTKQYQLMKAVRQQKQPTARQNLAISGNDLIAIGYPEGQMIGQLLDNLMAAVIDDPSLNEKERLIELAKRQA